MTHKIPQPYRSPGDFACYLKGVTEAAKRFGFAVDSAAWGGGSVPIDLTLYDPRAIPPKVVTVDDEAGYITMDVTAEVNPDLEDGEPNAGT